MFVVLVERFFIKGQYILHKRARKLIFSRRGFGLEVGSCTLEKFIGSFHVETQGSFNLFFLFLLAFGLN
jgi:hypothetical protein